MSALVFGSPQAQAVLAFDRRLAAMPDAERAAHSRQALELQIRFIDQGIEARGRGSIEARQRRDELARELARWGQS